MSTSAAQISEFIRANDVKFIRLAFCNLFGIQKNISVNAAHFERSISRGIPFDASSVQGFSSLGSDDAVLCPDLDTLTVLPWRPTQGRVARFLCDLLSSDGTTFFLDTRHLLKDAVAAAKKMDLEIQLGPECEFYLFKTDDDGEPTHLPHDFGTYFDIAPLDRGENVRREICLTPVSYTHLDVYKRQEIIRSIAVMRDRSNGLGGGFAGYGIYPQYKDFYALHVFYDSPETRRDGEAFLERQDVYKRQVMNSGSSALIRCRLWPRPSRRAGPRAPPAAQDSASSRAPPLFPTPPD